MDTKLDLVEILKDCPKDMKLYSTIHGEVALNYVNSERVLYPICVSWGDGLASFTQNGRFYTTGDGECVLFPSKDQRDWYKFVVPQCRKERFNPETLKPFDKVITRLHQGIWCCELFSFIEKNSNLIKCCGAYYAQCVPYNDETQHLVGTTDGAPEYYKYWED